MNTIHNAMELAVSSAPLIEKAIESTNDYSMLTDQEDDSEVVLIKKFFPMRLMPYQ